jgi:hypothetical protein
MALEALDPCRFIRVAGRVHVALAFDPDTHDVVAMSGNVRLTSENVLSLTDALTLEKAESGPSSSRQVLHKGEYEPGPPYDQTFPWPTTGRSWPS